MGRAGWARQRRRWVGAALVGSAVGGILVAAAPAAADHEIDASTKGPEARECSLVEYPASNLVEGGSESRQSFVQNTRGLAAIEVCLSNLVGVAGPDFTLHVYRGGTPADPGPEIAAVEHDAGSGFLAPQWVRVDLPGEGLVTTTGEVAYVVGIEPVSAGLNQVTLEWRSTCSTALVGSCLLTDDAYPEGSTSDLPLNADYGFATFAMHTAELVGDMSVEDAVCPGLDLQASGRASGTVRNDSETPVDAFDSEWVWSPDAVLDPTDRVIAGSRTRIGGLAPHASAPVPAPVLPADLPYGPGYLLLHVDVNDEVIEGDDANVAGGETTVTACGQPAMTIELDIAEPTATAGFNQLQFDDLDPRALATFPQSPAEAFASPGFSPNGFSPNGFSPNGFSPNGFSANGFSPNGFSPNGFSPNGFSPNGFSPNGFSPNGFSPNGFSGAGVALVADVLDDLPPGLPDVMHVVNVPIVGEGWEARLAGLTDEPIQNVTLGEAVALLPDLTLDEVDLTRVVTMSWLGLALANGVLADLPIDWCALIAEHGSSCDELDVDPSTTSLLGLEARGFPAFQAPVAEIPLSQVTRNPDWLVMGLSLTENGSFSLEHTRLGQLAASTALVDPSAVVDCAAFDCDRPLVEAVAADAIRNVTVATLLGGLSPEGLDAAVVGDLALGTASLTSLNLATANWQAADPRLMDAACPPVTYRVRGTNGGEGASVDPTVTAQLAPGFVYLPGTVTLTVDGQPGHAQGEPSEALAAGVRTYTFDLDAEIRPDTSFELAFSACASVYLGHVAVGSATLEGFGIEGPYSAATDSTDTVEVVERTPGSTTVAASHDDNIVIADHISQANDHDRWTFPVKEPGTMYVVRLFPPIGVDLDLTAYMPASSALAFNPNGFSPNGFSPNGFSPNGFSANGFSPNGFSPNGFSPNGFSPNGFSATAPPDLNDDIPIAELRPPGSSGYALSANRGDTPETLFLFSEFGDAGELTFAVSDYNGSRSDAPYFLTIQTFAPADDPRLDRCSAAPWDLIQAPGSAPANWTGSEPPRTIFVTNRQVTASVYGAAAADAGIGALQELASRPEVRGIVLNVDHHADVRAAYASWRGDWCNPVAANAVASHIRSLILSLRAAHPTIDTIVLAGTDALIPDWRLPDRSVLANEDQYTDALLNATATNNALVAAYEHRTIPSADPYGNEHPLSFGVTLAFPPSAGVSRLVETPADWMAQRDRYVASNGNLDPAAAFVSAYDGQVDGASAAADVLDGAGVPATRLFDTGGSWTAADFRAGAFRPERRAGVWNGHANHWALLSDEGSEQNDPSEVVTTAESASFPVGGLVLSNGCHFGVSVADVLNGSATPEELRRLNDWAEALSGGASGQARGVAVANSGFGIFDTIEIGQGERLQQYYLEELGRSRNASLALARAKNRFFATAGIYDAYSYKTAHQLSMFGLGIFKLFGSTADPAPPPPAQDAARARVTAGPYTVDTAGTSSCTDCFRLEATPAGTAVDLHDPDAETTHASTSGYWSAPLSIHEVPLPPGKLSAGIWINDIDSVTLHGVDPVIARLGVDQPDHEIESQTAAPFPTSVGFVADVGRTAYATLSNGFFVPTHLTNGTVVGDLHLHTRVSFDVVFRPSSTIGVDPHIDEVTVVRSEDRTRALITVLAPGAGRRAAALARTSDGEWQYVELLAAPGGRWTGAFLLGAGQTLEDLHVQAASDVGIGHWRFKGDQPVINQDGVQGVDVVFSGTRHSSGIFTSPVQATVVGTPGVVYRALDNDRPVAGGQVVDGQTFTVDGDGAHEITLAGGDGSYAARTIAIDTVTPRITWTSPPNGASYRSGTPVTVEVSCADSSGVQCTIRVNGAVVTNGSALPTSQIGTYTVRVDAVDGVGNTYSETRTYTVTSRYVMTQFFSPIKPKPQLNVVSPNSTVSLKFDVTTPEGVELTDPSIITARRWRPIDCRSKAYTGAAFPATGTAPTYSSYFHFNVAAPSAVGCYELSVVLDDGTSQSAYFQVKR